MKEAIKRLRSIGERGMAQSDYREVDDSLALYRQDLELVLSVHNDIARYLVLIAKYQNETQTLEEAKERWALEDKLSKVGKEE